MTDKKNGSHVSPRVVRHSDSSIMLAVTRVIEAAKAPPGMRDAHAWLAGYLEGVSHLKTAIISPELVRVPDLPRVELEEVDE